MLSHDSDGRHGELDVVGREGAGGKVDRGDPGRGDGFPFIFLLKWRTGTDARNTHTCLSSARLGAKCP